MVIAALQAQSSNITAFTHFFRHARGFCNGGGNHWRFGGTHFPFWGPVSSYERAVKQRDETLKRLQAIKAGIEQNRRKWGPAIDTSWVAAQIRQLDKLASEKEEKVRQARRGVENLKLPTESWKWSRLWPMLNDSSPQHQVQLDNSSDIDPITNRRIDRRPKTVEQPCAPERLSFERKFGLHISAAAHDLPLQSSILPTEPDVKAIVRDELEKRDSQISATQAKIIAKHFEPLFHDKLIPEALDHRVKGIDAYRPQVVDQVVKEAVEVSSRKLQELFENTANDNRHLHQLDVEKEVNEHIPKLRALLIDAVDEEVSKLGTRVKAGLDRQNHDFRTLILRKIEELRIGNDYLVKEVMDDRVSELKVMTKDAVTVGMKSVTDTVMDHIQNHDARFRALESHIRDSSIQPANGDTISGCQEKIKDVPIESNSPRDMRGLLETVPSPNTLEMNNKHFQLCNLGQITLLLPRVRSFLPTPLLNQVGKRHPKKAALKVLRALIQESKKSQQANGQGFTLVLARSQADLLVAGSSSPQQRSQRLQNIHNNTKESPSTEERPLNTVDGLEPLLLYKIVLYDPAWKYVVSTDDTSSIPKSAKPLTAYELFDRLEQPAKFFPHYIRLKKKGYDIVSSIGDAIIYRKVRDVDRGRKCGQLRAPSMEPDSPSIPHNTSINPIDMTGGRLHDNQSDWGQSSPRHGRFTGGVITVVLIAIGGKLVHDALFEIYMGESRKRHRDKHWPWEPMWRDESGQTERIRPPREHGSSWRITKSTS